MVYLQKYHNGANELHQFCKDWLVRHCLFSFTRSHIGADGKLRLMRKLAKWRHKQFTLSSPQYGWKCKLCLAFRSVPPFVHTIMGRFLCVMGLVWKFLWWTKYYLFFPNAKYLMLNANTAKFYQTLHKIAYLFNCICLSFIVL